MLFEIILWFYFNYTKLSKTNVLLGANFAHNNGIWYHTKAIKKYCKHSIAMLPPDNMMNHYSGGKFASLFGQFRSRKNFFQSSQVLHTHVYPWMIELAHFLKKEKNIYWIHTYHAPYQKEYAVHDLLPWQKEFNKVWVEVASKADVCISVSKWQQDYYWKEYGIQTQYLPNGVDVVNCDKANGNRFKKKLGKGDFILNVSRHDPVKSPTEFVALAKKMTNEFFVIIGGGLSKEVFLKEYNIDVPTNLLIYGAAPKAEVLDAIKACKVLVSNSKKEGLPTLILEAMALEKPIVVSNEPGSMEAIGQGEYGYFYELGNIDELQRKIKEAFLDKLKPIHARQRVLDHYDWRVIAPQLDKIYKGEIPKEQV